MITNIIEFKNKKDKVIYTLINYEPSTNDSKDNYLLADNSGRMIRVSSKTLVEDFIVIM